MDAQPVRQPVTRAAAVARLAVGLALALVAASCAPARPPVAAPPVPDPRAIEASRAAVKDALPFLHDDWPRALAEGKRTGKLVFVDAWAPWCHSCQSLRAFVLTDRALAPLADGFVWLSIDTDRDANAAFVARFPSTSWPTLWVFDPRTERPVMKWAGTATAPELLELLGAVRAAHGSGGEPSGAVAFVRGNHAAARGDMEEAERAYREALASESAHRGRAAEALVGLLSERDDHRGCAALAERVGAALPPGTSRATLLATGLSCAREGRLRPELMRLYYAVTRAAADPDPRVIADDRSALFEEIVETAKAIGDAAEAKAAATRWAAYLEGEASRAPTKQARAVFDAHRLTAYIAMGEPGRAVSMLEESERDFPDDYNPPARLARAHLEAGSLERARQAIDRAAAQVYGPRALRVFALAADIAKARGDAPAERLALEQAIARTRDAALSPAQERLRASLAERLQAASPP